MLIRGRLLLVCVAAAAAAIVISACGGGDGASSDDPASLAPAGAPIYIQATIRPKGKTKTDVESLARTVSGLDDPTGRLIELIDEALADEPGANGKRLTFATDIDPWLGERAGLFVEGLGEDDPPAAGIIQTTDADAAQQFIDDAKQEDDGERSYEGADYLVTDDGTAVGIVDDFVVAGAVRAFKDAVDVSEGGDSLGDQGDFQDTLDDAPSGSIGDVYVSLEAVTEAVRADNPDDAQSFEAAIGETSGKTLLASLVPAADRAELDISTNANPSFSAPPTSRSCSAASPPTPSPRSASPTSAR